jgi:hypothetical protein
MAEAIKEIMGQPVADETLTRAFEKLDAGSREDQAISRESDRRLDRREREQPRFGG